MNKAKTQVILSRVKNVYKQIANEFSDTRKYPWQEFKSFAKYVNKGDSLLDIGCGNGRLADIFPAPDYNYTGIDNAEEFISIAKSRNSKSVFMVADMQLLPFENIFFDHIFSIASFHHLPNEELRVKALNEMYRVLKPGGYLFITAWNLFEQKKYSKYIKEAAQRDSGDFESKRDILIPWGDKKIPRYYYAFLEDELKDLVKQTGFDILSANKDRNIVLICQK